MPKIQPIYRKPAKRWARALLVSCLLANCRSVPAQQPSFGNGLGLPATGQNLQQPSPPVQELPAKIPLPVVNPAPNQFQRMPPEAPAAAPDNAAPMSEREKQFLLERIDPERTLDVQVGRPTVLRFRSTPFRDQVGDPEIIDVINLTETEFSITGKATGSTVLNFWFESKDQAGGQEVLSYLVRVADDPERSRRFEALLENLERDVNRAFPNSVVDLGYVGAEVLVRGKAKDIEEATNILRIVSQSLPTDAQQTQLSVTEAIADNNSLVNPAVIQAAAVRDPTGLPLTGPFAPPLLLDPASIVDAGGVSGLARGNTITGANPARINNRVVNMLEIAGVHQVMLKVTMAEVVRNATRSLLSDIAIGDSAGILAGTTVDFSTLPNGAGSFQIETNNFELRLNALKQLNLARSLAEPNLTTLNGQPATFLVGGQFPVQEAVATVGAVGTSITYVPFGIQLTALTTVTDNDRIRLNLQAAITELANGNRQGQGQGQEPAQNSPTNPPSLSTRSFMTTVEMRESESLAIAGLIRTSLNNTSSKVPFLGDLPVIGTLFSKNTTAAQEQELILVVTPHLVSPVNYEQVQPLPGSDVFEADDLQFFLMGRTEGNVAEDYRSPVRSDLHKMKAFRHVEQKYIVGTPGHSSGRPVPAAQYPTPVAPTIVPESQPLLPEGVQP